LAKRKDGTCIFLEPDGLCRIHKEHGFDAKPLVCRMFPFQVVELDQFAYLTVRRYCPSAAADSGRDVEDYLPEVRQLADERNRARAAAGEDPRTEPPSIVRGQRSSWKEFLRVADVLQRLLLDERYPHVRRVVHGLEFCRLLGQCRLHRLSAPQLASLLEMLENSAVNQAAGFFRDRRAPGRVAGLLFRQTALEYVRLHPKYVIRSSLAERWRLIVAATAFARGQGSVPRIHPQFPATTFEALEAPLGSVGAEVLAPLDKYLEVVACSKQYALLSRRHWSLLESFEALALAYAVALWTVRFSSGPRPPELSDVIDAVGTIDRGQGYELLSRRRHRSRVGSLVRLRELPRIVAWYAR